MDIKTIDLHTDWHAGRHNRRTDKLMRRQMDSNDNKRADQQMNDLKNKSSHMRNPPTTRGTATRRQKNNGQANTREKKQTNDNNSKLNKSNQK